MTPRERIRAAVAHRPVDWCPYALGFPAALRQRLIELTGDDAFDRDVVTHSVNVGSSFPNTWHPVEGVGYRDDFGVLWEEAIRGEIGVVREPVLPGPTLEGYTFPDPNYPDLLAGAEDQLAAHPELYSFWNLGFSLYERAWSLRGMEPFLTDMVERPAFAHELLDRICDFNLGLIERACALPIDGVRFGDDWGAQSGLIMGPALWREFIKPRFARMVGAARAAGKAVFLHSDGDIREIIADLIEVGLSILNPVQPDVMDIYEVKREFGRDLAFWGGVSVQHLLPEATPEELRAEVRRLIGEVGAGGGFVVSPTHSLGSDIPPENLLVLMEEFVHQAPPG